jgi:hypothetical protein
MRTDRLWIPLVILVAGLLFTLALTGIAAGSLANPQPPNARVPTTLADYFLPGTQPNWITNTITAYFECQGCHSEEYNPREPLAEAVPNWKGSTMAQAARDPLFWAGLPVANQDASISGNYCLHCHAPKAWLEGRGLPPDGSALQSEDFDGVQCEVCHRLVDPVYAPGNPDRDPQILQALTTTVTITGSGTLVVDTADHRRGPFEIVPPMPFDPHPYRTYRSPFHQEAALCGTCHNISNPILSWDAAANEYRLNPLNQPPASIADDVLFPLSRTFSEWWASDYNTPQGVYAPQFGGNKDYVSICQDCHLRDVTGSGSSIAQSLGITRTDIPQHDMTGGNTWVAQTLMAHPVFSNTVDHEALISATLRATYMLTNAATLDVLGAQGGKLRLRVTNESGHKLPTGKPDGRRIWLNVQAFDASNQLIFESGHYDPATGVLTLDAAIKVYQAKQGLTPYWAGQLGGLPPGPSFHLMLNNAIFFDNRIPPRGFTNAAFAVLQAAPVGYSYADGQYWDDTRYSLPCAATRATVTLYYQTASKEFVEFLRDENTTNGDGQLLYDLWTRTNRAAPVAMTSRSVNLPGDCRLYLPTILK